MAILQNVQGTTANIGSANEGHGVTNIGSTYESLGVPKGGTQHTAETSDSHRVVHSTMP
jgi:hypothetical protein